MAVIVRETKETQIRMELALGGDVAANVASTSIPFLDHMLITLARYAGVSMRVSAQGDLRHHVIEDVAICAGAAFREITPATCQRYGDRTIPMDDALVHCAIDLGGRAYYRGPLPSHLYDHWMRSFADNAKASLHLRVLRGTDRHHVVEAAFKALGLAMRESLAEGSSVFSTKGAASLVIGPC